MPLETIAVIKWHFWFVSAQIPCLMWILSVSKSVVIKKKLGAIIIPQSVSYIIAFPYGPPHTPPDLCFHQFLHTMADNQMVSSSHCL